MKRIYDLILSIFGLYRLEVSNGSATGTHEGTRRTFLADGAIPRFGVVKIGSDAYHVSANTTAATSAQTAAASVFGVAVDQAEAAEDPVSVILLGGGVTGTIRLISDGTAAIAQGDFLVASATSGKVKTGATTTGYWWVIGRAVQAVSNGAAGDAQIFEAIPMGSHRVIA